MATKKQSVKVAKKVGKPSAWDKTIKPHLAEIEQWRRDGATMNQIAKNLGLTAKTLYEVQNKQSEFRDCLARAKIGREEHMVGKMWELASGDAVRVEETDVIDKQGNKIGVQRRVIHIEPQLSAQLAFLKQYHGWSDNPKVDEATAKALSDKELREFVNKTLRVSDDDQQAS